MSRKRRYWFPGAMYHITSRGNRRFPIFYDDVDRKKYLQFLKESREKFPFHLFSYCLMPNHIHLLLETIDHPPKDFMSTLHYRYAIYFNRRHDFVGHVFQERYGAKHIDSIKYLLIASRYIHLNPLKAELVDNPLSYKWSSYSSYINDYSPKLVMTEKILSYFPDPTRENYQRFVERSK